MNAVTKYQKIPLIIRTLFYKNVETKVSSYQSDIRYIYIHTTINHLIRQGQKI